VTSRCFPANALRIFKLYFQFWAIHADALENGLKHLQGQDKWQHLAINSLMILQKIVLHLILTEKI